MTEHLPEDPSQFMNNLPSPDSLGVPAGELV